MVLGTNARGQCMQRDYSEDGSVSDPVDRYMLQLSAVQLWLANRESRSHSNAPRVLCSTEYCSDAENISTARFSN